MPQSVTHPTWRSTADAPVLSPDQRRGLRRATWELHHRLWTLTGTPIDMDVIETIAAYTILAYLHGVADPDEWSRR